MTLYLERRIEVAVKGGKEGREGEAIEGAKRNKGKEGRRDRKRNKKYQFFSSLFFVDVDRLLTI